MKRFLTILGLLLMSLQMFAQVYSTADWGSFKLRGDEKFGVMFDYKGGEYNGYPYKEFIDEFPDFLTEVKEVESRFIAEINDCFSGSRFPIEHSIYDSL